PRGVQRAGEFGVPDAAGGVTGGRLERLLPALERLAGAALRVWRCDGTGVRPLAGAGAWRPGAWAPALDGPAAGRSVETPEGRAWLEPVRAADGVWLEVRPRRPARGRPAGAAAAAAAAATLAEIVGAVLDAERDAAQVAAELSDRYEEIDLLYSISEILGHTIRLDEAAGAHH